MSGKDLCSRRKERKPWPRRRRKLRLRKDNTAGAVGNRTKAVEIWHIIRASATIYCFGMEVCSSSSKKVVQVGRSRRKLPLPASGSTTGQYQTALGDRKTDFFGFHMTAEFLRQCCIYHIGQHSGLQSGRVGIDQEEQRIIG